MNTFAEKLKIALKKRELSQAEAARLCGIAQQSLNYIISNNLNSSKLALQIASSLNINPEWLILGQGKFEETKLYELPIIHSPYMLKKFLQREIDENTMDYTVINVFLGDTAFAYLTDSKKIAICATEIINVYQIEYLNITNAAVIISKEKEELSFPIFEWRIRNVDF